MKTVPIRIGDVYALGEHRLLCGDCCNQSLIQSFLGSEKINLMLLDPPYGVSYVDGKKGFTQSKQVHKNIQSDHLQSDEEYRNFSRTWIEAALPSFATKNALYIFNSDKMMVPLILGLRDAGCHFGQLLIWAKTAAVIGRLDYIPQHEIIIYGWYKTHAFQKSKDKSVLVCPKTQKNDLHPTMKPVSLLRRLILNSSKIGDVVYDSFGGSGSTLIAAEQTKRRCFMVEIDPDYCQVIIDRYEQLTGNKAEKLLPHLSHA